MPYKIRSLRVRNFKCFDNSQFYEFKIDTNKNPVILTGPNGYGKTTFFDAVELVFSKRITRFEKHIEKQNIDLKKNVLINASDFDGYIICTLINELKECLSLIVRIDHKMRQVSYEESITYGIAHNYIETDKLYLFLLNYQDWKTNLSDFEVLNYSSESFNVFYYVSQAESVHFLKKSIASRKEIINVLLDIDDLSERSTFIENKLIGKQSNSPNVIINDKILELNQLIQKDIKIYKEKLAKINVHGAKQYFPIINISDDNDRPYWDKENTDEVSVTMLQNGLKELKRLHHFTNDYVDYKNYIWNRKLDGAIIKGIPDYLLYRKYFTDNNIDLWKIQKEIENKNTKLELYNNAAFLRNKEIDPNFFNKEELLKITKLSESVIDFDIEELGIACENLKELNRKIDARQSVIRTLSCARNALSEASNNYDSTNSCCPYCGYKYENVDELSNAYKTATDLLDKEKGEDLKASNELKTKIESIISGSRKKLYSLLGETIEQEITSFPKEISALTEFCNDKKRLVDVEFLYPIFAEDASWENLSLNEKKLELERIALSNKKTYSNALFPANCTEYNYDSVISDYANIVWDNQELIKDEEQVNNKRQFIENLISQKEHQEIQEIRNRLNNNIRQYITLGKVYKNIKEIKTIYDREIESYKKQIIDRLRVPLLIYSGKLLQDHQSGLGVFIDEKDMRFITDGASKNDILNTFSSGQLAAFVLAFLFAMNKLYAKELPKENKVDSEGKNESDDLGFILIDDPVQTMDDINIASLIEVLRNDFSEKQIILSTHEIDKENYMLYKFLKYNMVGQSFNVKDELYII